MDSPDSSQKKRALLIVYNRLGDVVEVAKFVSTSIGGLAREPSKTMEFARRILKNLLKAPLSLAFAAASWFSYRRLARFLKLAGYDVEIVRSFGADWKEKLGGLAGEATPNSTTVIIYAGHGGMVGGSSTIPIGKPGSQIRLKDSDFINAVAAIPGGKIISLSTCQAGGFVEKAANLSAMEKERLILLTSSDAKNSHAGNPLFASVRQSLGACSNGGEFMNEFLRRNSRLGAFRKKFTNYEPKHFAGSKAQAIRI